MSTSKKPVAVADEQKPTPVINAETPAQTETPAAPVTLADLERIADEKAEAAMAARKAVPRDNAAISAANLEAYKADQAVQKFIAAQKAEEASREYEQKVQQSYDVVADKLGISRETLDEQLKDTEGGVPSVLRTALQTIVGKPAIHAKDGQTGKSLSGNTASANGQPKGAVASQILDLYNGGNGLTAAQIIDKGFARGTTHSVILAWKKANGKA